MKFSAEVRALMKKYQTACNDAKAILAAAAEDGDRDLTEEETEQHAKLVADARKYKKLFEDQKELEASGIEMPGSAEPPTGTLTGGAPAAEKDPKAGFDHFGDFATTVALACKKTNAFVDDRLQILAEVPSTAASGAIGEDGGFTVPQDFREDIMSGVLAEDSLLDLTDQYEMEGYSTKVPVDENQDWDNTNGIQVYWEDELGQLNQSKPALKMVEWYARKNTALVPISNELLEDGRLMDGYLRRKAPDKMRFSVSLALMFGNGVGRPLGALESPAAITVAKESGQAADTVVRQNIDNIWMRMPATMRRDAVWIVNQDIESQLQALQFPGTESPHPIYLPAGGYSAQPYDTLKGRPVIYHQAAATLGDKGDISLINWKQYSTVIKRGGIKTDVSMHLYFDADAMAYRFILRIGGQPWLSAPISPRVGSNTMSPFVTLAERA